MNTQRFLDKFITKRHHIIVEETDVLNALKVINKYHKIVPEIAVGNCGWADDTNKWFIHFTTTNSKWDGIRKDLKVVRVFSNLEIPKEKNGTVYSTD